MTCSSVIHVKTYIPNGCGYSPKLKNFLMYRTATGLSGLCPSILPYLDEHEGCVGEGIEGPRFSLHRTSDLKFQLRCAASGTLVAP